MTAFPKVFRLRQSFDAAHIADVPGEVHAQLARLDLGRRVRPGQSVAITAGSRGIANIAAITRAIVAHFAALGAKPFLVPAMGSHGGGTADGQRRVIEALGITEKYVGCPIRSSVETVVIGHAGDCPNFRLSAGDCPNFRLSENGTFPPTPHRQPFQSTSIERRSRPTTSWSATV